MSGAKFAEKVGCSYISSLPGTVPDHVVITAFPFNYKSLTV